jgi:hypothetical protein
MESESRLGWFISFILLSARKKRAVTVRNFTHTQPAFPELLPLARFLMATLHRARTHELSHARKPVAVELVFRIGQPEQGSGEKEKTMNRSTSSSIGKPGNGIQRKTGFALAFLFLLATAFVVPNAAKADNLVQNGGFETGDFSNWTVTGDTQGAQVVNDGGAHSGTYYAKFNAIDGYVDITQTISTPHTPNTPSLYDLIFWEKLVDLPPTDFQVFWGSELIADFRNTGSQEWTKYEFDGLSANQQQTQLTFAFKVFDPQSFFGLDDISVSGQAPEPGSLMLLGSGVLALAGVARRQLMAKGLK